ncbi:MAG: TVP38/TMEM64 family protein, partial [Synechococcaceae cyanobacterium RL_1_2]|nr:TVP38/TMEM64 family protein [Synechococcaceae cyanobacterium RL_1_2]
MPNLKQADQSTYSKFFKYFKYGLFAIAVIGGVVLFKLSPLGQWISEIFTTVLNWVQSLGNAGIVIFIIVYIGATMVLVSGAILTLGAGLIFGVVKGSIIVSIASTAGATAAFLVGRYFVRDWVVQQIEKQPKFKAIDQAVAKDGWKIVGLTRLSPLFPFV